MDQNIQIINIEKNPISRSAQTFEIVQQASNNILGETQDNSFSHQFPDQVSFSWLLKSCFEEALSYFFEWVPTTIALYFVADQYSQEIVSGFGLGLVWNNCVGQGLYYGLCSGLETMASHAHGAKNYKQVGLLFQKTLYISLIMFIPISLCMIYSQNIISLWNDDPKLSYIAGQYCMHSLPGIFFAAIYYAYKATLNAQNAYRLQVYSSGINIGFTLLYCIIFITKLDLGIKGASIIFSLTEFSNVLICYLFAKRVPQLSKCYIPYTNQCRQDLLPFLKQAVPIGSLLSLEWMLQEANSIIASNLNAQQYSAHIVLANLLAVCNQFVLGYSTAACTFIGNEMGRGKVANAKKYSLYSLCIVVSHLLLTVTPVYIMQNKIAEAFAVDNNVKEELVNIFGLFLLVYCMDSFQCYITAFMRAIAQEKYSSFSFIFSYATVGLTSSYFLAYKAGFQIKGIWFGTCLGLSVYLILQFKKILQINLNKMSNIILGRIEYQESLNNKNKDKDKNNECKKPDTYDNTAKNMMEQQFSIKQRKSLEYL